jgi:hypothetical protein
VYDQDWDYIGGEAGVIVLNQEEVMLYGSYNMFLLPVLGCPEETFALAFSMKYMQWVYT